MQCISLYQKNNSILFSAPGPSSPQNRHLHHYSNFDYTNFKLFTWQLELRCFSHLERSDLLRQTLMPAEVCWRSSRRCGDHRLFDVACPCRWSAQPSGDRCPRSPGKRSRSGRTTQTAAGACPGRR